MAAHQNIQVRYEKSVITLFEKRAVILYDPGVSMR